MVHTQPTKAEQTLPLGNPTNAVGGSFILSLNHWHKLPYVTNPTNSELMDLLYFGHRIAEIISLSFTFAGYV